MIKLYKKRFIFRNKYTPKYIEKSIFFRCQICGYCFDICIPFKYILSNITTVCTDCHEDITYRREDLEYEIEDLENER